MGGKQKCTRRKQIRAHIVQQPRATEAWARLDTRQLLYGMSDDSCTRKDSLTCCPFLRILSQNGSEMPTDALPLGGSVPVSIIVVFQATWKDFAIDYIPERPIVSGQDVRY